MSQDTAHESNLSFDIVLDLCLDDLVMGRATVEACLNRYPQHRMALEPILRTAMAVSDIPVEVPTPNPAHRAAFMTALRETPQDQPRFRIPVVGVPNWSMRGLWRGALIGVPAAVIALLAIVFVTATNPSTASAAALTVFVGDVERQDGDTWVTLNDGDSVSEAMTIRTGAASRALLTFPDGSTATVDASTEITLQRIAVGRTREIDISQSTGRIWSDVVPGAEGDSYVVHTPHATVSAFGTVFETFVDGVTSVRADAGLVRLSARGESVDIHPGQRATADATMVGIPVTANVTAHISVDAPAVAYLTSTDGAATGALPNGIVFRQVPGIATGTDTTNGGGQQFTLGDVSPGRYSLVVERLADGDGDVVIDTPAGRLVLPVPASSALSRVEVEIEERDGVRTLRTISTAVQDVTREETPDVRISEAARSRTDIDIAALAAARRAEAATPEASVAAAPTRESGALATPAAPATPDASRSDDRRGGPPGFFFPGRQSERPEATPTETLRTPERNSDDQDPGQDRGGRDQERDDRDRDRDREDRDEAQRWERAFRDAIRSNNDRELATLLREALTGDPDVDEDRVEAILDATEDRNVRRRIARLLANETGLETAEALRDALNEAKRGAGDFISERIPALPTPALPVRPPVLQPADDGDAQEQNQDRDQDGREDGRFPFPWRR